MGDEDAFLRSIPKFLRRPREPAPEDPMFGTGQPPGDGAAASRPDASPGRPLWPAAKPAAPVPPAKPRALPWLAQKRRLDPKPTPPTPMPAPAPASGPAAPEAPDPPGGAAIPPAAAPTAPEPTERRADAPGSVTPRLLQAALQEAIGADPGIGGDDDAAFQVTLPRSIIRQIRVCAAEEGTTQRAIILRALRAAGLNVPEGADVDRRGLVARRRHQG